MWEKINNFLKGQIVTSIIYIALGACLVFMPVSTVNVYVSLYLDFADSGRFVSYPDLCGGKTEFHDF